MNNRQIAARKRDEKYSNKRRTKHEEKWLAHRGRYDWPDRDLGNQSYLSHIRPFEDGRLTKGVMYKAYLAAHNNEPPATYEEYDRWKGSLTYAQQIAIYPRKRRVRVKREIKPEIKDEIPPAFKFEENTMDIG